MDDSPLLALEDRIRSINPHAPIIRANFCKVDSKALLNMSVFSKEKVLGEEPDFLQSGGTDHVHDNTVSSGSWSFPGLELNVNELQARIGSLSTKGVLAVKGCREKFVCQDVHMSLSVGFASHVMSGSDTSCATWQDGEGRECRFVSIDRERKQNAVNFKRDFLLYAAEEILRFKVNDQVQRRGLEVDKRWMVDVTRKEHSQQQARKEHSQRQAERTRRNASPTTS